MKKNATGTRKTLHRAIGCNAAVDRQVKVLTMENPHGRDWTWYRDLRIVTLSPRLDEQGRERAMEELRAQLASC